MNEPLQHKSRTWLALVVLATLVVYPLSFGPACWMASRMDISAQKLVDVAYAPVRWTYHLSPAWMQRLISGYANLSRKDVLYRILIFDDSIHFLDGRDYRFPMGSKRPSMHKTK